MSEVRSFVGDPCSAYSPSVPQGHTGLSALVVMPTFGSGSPLMAASYHESRPSVKRILREVRILKLFLQTGCTLIGKSRLLV